MRLIFITSSSSRTQFSAMNAPRYDRSAMKLMTMPEQATLFLLSMVLSYRAAILMARPTAIVRIGHFVRTIALGCDMSMPTTSI